MRMTVMRLGGDVRCWEWGSYSSVESNRDKEGSTVVPTIPGVGYCSVLYVPFDCQHNSRCERLRSQHMGKGLILEH